MTAVKKTEPTKTEPKVRIDKDEDNRNGGKIDASKSAVDAAVDEVNEADLRIEWRGVTFVIPRATLTSARFLMAFKTNELHSLLYELIGSENASRFIDLCKPGEGLGEVAESFFAELNKATGVGNF